MMRLAVGMMLASAIGGGAVAAERPEGRWVTASGNVEVQIAPCGRALCGTVVHVMANHSMDDPTKSINKPATVGLRIMSGFTPSGEGRWTGKIFNREDHKTYDCIITPSSRTMTVRPYVVTPLIGKSQTWVRIDL